MPSSRQISSSVNRPLLDNAAMSCARPSDLRSTCVSIERALKLTTNCYWHRIEPNGESKGVFRKPIQRRNQINHEERH